MLIDVTIDTNKISSHSSCRQFSCRNVLKIHTVTLLSFDRPWNWHNRCKVNPGQQTPADPREKEELMRQFGRICILLAVVGLAQPVSGQLAQINGQIIDSETGD